MQNSSLFQKNSCEKMTKLKTSLNMRLTPSKVKKRYLEIDSSKKKTPTPESIMRVSTKLDLLNSFKSNFQSNYTQSRFLTPIPKSDPKLPSVNFTSLEIKHYGLGDNQAKLLSKAIQSMNKLEKVDLKNTGMNDSGTFSILESVNQDNLRTLDISSNRIGHRGIISLNKILAKENSYLEELNLENVKMSVKGLLSLCSTIKYNSSLKVLNMANNHLGINSGKALGDMIDYNSSLESLDLQ